MPSDEVTVHYGIGAGYVDAAVLILDSGHYPSRVGLIGPVQTLIGLSLELLLKAVAIHQSVNPKVLKKVEVRHNLMALAKETQAHGFEIKSPVINKIIADIGANYAAHEYRYMKHETTVTYVHGTGIVGELQEFMRVVARETGIPERPRYKEETPQ